MAKKTLIYVPQVVDLVLYAGDGASFSLKVTDPTAAPIAVTGTILAQIRLERDTADPPLAVFTADMTNAATGTIVLSLTGSETQSLVTTDQKFVGVWDVQWTAVGAEPVTLCQGKVECMPDVSRA